MKDLIQSSQAKLAQFSINTNDYFVVTFWRTSGEIDLQAHYSTEMFDKCQPLLKQGFSYCYLSPIHTWINNSENIRISLS